MSPYLFVIAMEYLNREIRCIDRDKGFQYHPRYNKLLVKHICFADDLLMFCKADLPSIVLIQEGFQ